MIAVVSNLGSHGEHRFSWARLVPSLVLIAGGLLRQCRSGCALQAEGALTAYLGGAALAIVANAAWTWYPIHNARWLNAARQHTSTTWATARASPRCRLRQSGCAFAAVVAPHWRSALSQSLSGAGAAQVLAADDGDRLLRVMARHHAVEYREQKHADGVDRQLIVFETLAALAYAYLVYQRSPSGFEIAGIVLLVLGVIVGAGRWRHGVARAPGPATCAVKLALSGRAFYSSFQASVRPRERHDGFIAERKFFRRCPGVAL